MGTMMRKPLPKIEARGVLVAAISVLPDDFMWRTSALIKVEPAQLLLQGEALLGV
jgi:hypothetical protein